MKLFASTGPDGLPEDRPSAQLIAVFVVTALLAVVVIVLLRPLVDGVSLAAALIAGVLYLMSHILRAVRIAFISVDLFGVSGRTGALMHLATAPIALALPFKTGELLRLHELWKLGGTFLYAIVALLIDRMYDSIFLIPLAILLLLGGSAPPTFVFLTLLAAIVPLTMIVIGPRLLSDVQRYMVSNHANPRVLDILRQVDAMRVLVLRAANVAFKRAPELSVISLLIWLCELAFCLILIADFRVSMTSAAQDALDLLGTRLVSSWWTTSTDPLLQPAMAIAMIAVLVFWPVAATWYLARRNHEPRRASAALYAKRRGGSE